MLDRGTKTDEDERINAENVVYIFQRWRGRQYLMVWHSANYNVKEIRTMDQTNVNNSWEMLKNSNCRQSVQSHKCNWKLEKATWRSKSETDMNVPLRLQMGQVRWGRLGLTDLYQHTHTHIQAHTTFVYWHRESVSMYWTAGGKWALLSHPSLPPSLLLSIGYQSLLL